MAYTKILAAIRSTKRPSPVFAEALEMAIEQKARLMLYHCSEIDRSKDHPEQGLTTTQIDMDTYKDRLKTRSGGNPSSSAWLEVLCEKAKKNGVDARCLVEEGRPGRRIVELANRWEADLIVLGRTRRGSIADCLFGTVSDHVIHNASCSLLLIQ